MLDQFIRAAFPTVHLPGGWHMRDRSVVKQDLRALFVQKRVVSCFLQSELPPPMTWDHHDLFGDCHHALVLASVAARAAPAPQRDQLWVFVKLGRLSHS